MSMCQRQAVKLRPLEFVLHRYSRDRALESCTLAIPTKGELRRPKAGLEFNVYKCLLPWGESSRESRVGCVCVQQRRIARARVTPPLPSRSCTVSYSTCTSARLRWVCESPRASKAAQAIESLAPPPWVRPPSPRRRESHKRI